MIPDHWWRPLEQDAAAIAEGFCPEGHGGLREDGWCEGCQIYLGTHLGIGGPVVTRSNDPDYAKSFWRD